MADYTDKIDALLEHATSLGFTEQDFAELTVAAADQSGASADKQYEIEIILGLSLEECANCGASTAPGAPVPHECAPSPLVADTITDEQIGKLCAEYLYAKPIPDSYGVDLCDRALGKQSRYRQPDAACTPDAVSTRKARRECAAIINARSPCEKAPPGIGHVYAPLDAQCIRCGCPLPYKEDK